MNNHFESFARRRKVIVMAGAGVSAAKPSALPGWKPMNASIVQALCDRLESAISMPGWLSQLVPVIDTERGTDHFPPDYQAQLIEEMCGDRYFRALQAFDIDVMNVSHDSIAAFAAAGAVKAVVTTNFDRLIEQALDKRGVPYAVAHSETKYAEMLQHLSAREVEPLPVIKIHGCASDHLSMIDTLKQRKRGRSRCLQECLDMLQLDYWLYLGFSAADLETDPGYLGLVPAAAKSAGATYVAYPRNAAVVELPRTCGKEERSRILSKGAQILMDAYGDSGLVVETYIAPFLSEACKVIGEPGPDPIPDDGDLGLVQFQRKLKEWADNLSPAATGLCLAAILEAIGHTEPAVRILDRLVRKELYEERDSTDFHAIQLHYGRLGAAWGRFVAVPDLAGAASNASVETTQSLYRLLDSELGFAAASWLACSWLWLNEGQNATDIAFRLIKGFLDNQWEGMQPRTDEEAVDAWISAAQVCILNSHVDTVGLLLASADAALTRANQSGDVVRTARVVALRCLALAETREDVPALLAQHKENFDEAERVRDGFALGMRALAHGRWLVGAGGLAMATDSTTVAQGALKALTEAVTYFRRQGMDPWELFVLVQQTKAYADLHMFDDAQACISAAQKGLDRFPILASHVFEAAGQVQTMLRDEDARESYRIAIEAAEESGLHARAETLLQCVRGAE